MAEIQDINAYRRQRKRKKQFKRFFYLLLLVGIVFGVYYAAQYYNILDGDELPVMDRVTANTGFPIKLSGDAPKDIAVLNKSFTFLTDKQLIFFKNSNGNELSNTVHGFNNPVMDASKDRVLLYDIGSSRYKILNKDRELYSVEIEDKILLGKINNNGYFGLVTNDSRYASVLTVYDKYNDDIFTWSTAERITALDFSDNGTKCAVATVDAENGQIISNVYTIDFSSKKELLKTSSEGSIILSLSYQSDSVFAVGDNATWQVNAGGDLENYIPYNQEISLLSQTDSRHPFIALGDNNVESRQLVSFDENGNKLAELQIQENVIAIENTDEYFCVLTKTKAYIYTKNFELVKKFENLTDCEMFAVRDKSIYIIEASAITKLKIN